MKKFQLIVFLTIIIFISIFIVVINNKPVYKKIKSYTKPYIGGVVYNETSKPIKVSDCLNVKIIPLQKSSKQMGVFDADSLIIDSPMYYKGKLYKNKVLKFCDYASLTIVEKNGKIEILTSPATSVCKVIDDFRFTNTMKEAFK